ncbi:hypothetical protein HG531_010529 [Fusarium graminearum]|nr:hypothetical protein HG531_010529 [Fusarium graminearum]
MRPRSSTVVFNDNLAIVFIFSNVLDVTFVSCSTARKPFSQASGTSDIFDDFFDTLGPFLQTFFMITLHIAHSNRRRSINSEVMMGLLEMLEEGVVDGVDIVAGNQKEVEEVGITILLVGSEEVIIEVNLGKVSGFGFEELST